MLSRCNSQLSKKSFVTGPVKNNPFFTNKFMLNAINKVSPHIFSFWFLFALEYPISRELTYELTYEMAHESWVEV